MPYQALLILIGEKLDIGFAPGFGMMRFSSVGLGTLLELNSANDLHVDGISFRSENNHQVPSATTNGM